MAVGSIVNIIPSVVGKLTSATNAGTRVHGGGLPENIVYDDVYTDQLKPTIVIKSAFGNADAYLPVGNPRLRVCCYAPTMNAAETLFFQVVNILHSQNLDDLTRGIRAVFSLNGGPNSDIDRDSKFIYCDGYFVGTVLKWR